MASNLDRARAEFALATFAPDSDPDGIWVAMRDCQLPSGGIPQPQAKLCATQEDAQAWTDAQHECYGEGKDHWVIFLPSFQDHVFELDSKIADYIFVRQDAHRQYVASLPRQEATHIAQQILETDEYIIGNTILVPNPAYKPDPSRIWHAIPQQELVEALGITEREAAILFNVGERGQLEEPKWWPRHPNQRCELMDGVYRGAQGSYTLVASRLISMGYEKYPERLEEWRKSQPKPKREKRVKGVMELSAEKEAKELKELKNAEVAKPSTGECPF